MGYHTRSAGSTWIWRSLAGIVEARCDLDDRELNLIETARIRQMAWREIAEALGLDSPQAAQQRYRRLQDRKVGIEDSAGEQVGVPVTDGGMMGP